MRSVAIIAFLSLCLAACGGGGDGDCNPGGTYDWRMVELSGNCGTFPGTNVEVAKGGQPSDTCTGSNAWSADYCTVLMDSDCCTDGDCMSTHGTINWNQSGSRGEGELQIYLSTSSGTCSSTYLATFIR